MKLIELLRELDYTLLSGNMNIELTGLEYDSRKVKEGSLFVCLTGFQTDGHDYIPDALAQGARALVVEKDLSPLPKGVTVIQVRDSRHALALLSAAWFGWPPRKMTTIALTGTKGKTTTAHMVKAILEAAGHKVGMIGTIGAMIGGEKIKTKNTTPESYELHALFARMVEAGCTHMVMEASSQGFKLHRTAGIQFDFGVFLNLSPDHIGAGEHADFGEYLHCKSMLFRQCRVGVANMDRPLLDPSHRRSGLPDPYLLSGGSRRSAGDPGRGGAPARLPGQRDHRHRADGGGRASGDARTLQCVQRRRRHHRGRPAGRGSGRHGPGADLCPGKGPHSGAVHPGTLHPADRLCSQCRQHGESAVHAQQLPSSPPDLPVRRRRRPGQDPAL